MLSSINFHCCPEFFPPYYSFLLVTLKSLTWDVTIKLFLTRFHLIFTYRATIHVMDSSTRHILPGDEVDSASHQENLHYYLVEHRRWKKKTLQARCLIGLMTLICCILIVVLIVTYESGRRKSRSTRESSKREGQGTAGDVNLIKFIHLSDIHYDPFYNKMISSSSYCRQQVAKSTAKYIAEYGRIGCDSPAMLVENSLDAMKNVSQEEDIAFILMTGRADFNSLNILETCFRFRLLIVYRQLLTWTFSQKIK